MNNGIRCALLLHRTKPLADMLLISVRLEAFRLGSGGLGRSSRPAELARWRRSGVAAAAVADASGRSTAPSPRAAASVRGGLASSGLCALRTRTGSQRCVLHALALVLVLCAGGPQLRQQRWVWSRRRGRRRQQLWGGWVQRQRCLRHLYHRRRRHFHRLRARLCQSRRQCCRSSRSPCESTQRRCARTLRPCGQPALCRWCRRRRQTQQRQLRQWRPRPRRLRRLRLQRLRLRRLRLRLRERFARRT